MDINPSTGICSCCGEIVSGDTCVQCRDCGHVETVAEVAPFAVFAYDWPGVGRMFRVIGGASSGSDVLAETLMGLGIAVPSCR